MGRLCDFIDNAIEGTIQVVNSVAHGDIKGAVDSGVGHFVAGFLVLSPSELAIQLLQHVPGDLVGPIKQFTELLYAECDDTVVHADMDLAASVFVMLQQFAPVRYCESELHRTKDSPSFISLRYYLKHATAAYGQNPIVSIKSIFSVCDSSEVWIADNTGVSPKDVLRYKGFCEAYMATYPEYYVCIDREKQAVILAVRGTMSLKGITTDLNCKYRQYKGYKYHDGMFDGAWNLFQDSKDVIKSALEDNPTYKVVTTGHSLGGGVAALVAIFLSEKSQDGQFVTSNETVQGRNIHCYALECAATMCTAAATEFSSLISSLVHENDIVPSLCYGTFRDMRTYALYLKQNRGHLGNIINNIGNMALSGRNSETADRFLDTFRNLATSEKLVPAGTVFAVHTNPRLRFGKVLEVNTHFGVPKFICGMLLHHFPANVRASMDRF